MEDSPQVEGSPKDDKEHSKAKDDVCLTENKGAVDNLPVEYLSKKQLKRKIKEDFRKKKKEKKKADEKEVKRQRREEIERERNENPNVEKTEVKDHDTIFQSRKDRKDEALKKYLDDCSKNFAVIIDLNWEDSHTESSLKSLIQQVMHCYGRNKRHTNPAYTYLTGLGPKISTQLHALNCPSWAGVRMMDEDYINYESIFSKSPSNDNNTSTKQLVYLTSDAEETLESLDPSCVYVIGGIVDRNKLKGVTHKKAVSQGIRTAKLPIRENLDLKTTHVLTVNHVFEILLNFSQCQSWQQSIESVIPSRKKNEVPVEPSTESSTTSAKKETIPVDDAEVKVVEEVIVAVNGASREEIVEGEISQKMVGT